MSGSIAELGEFGLIRRLIEQVGTGEGVLVGPGDDAAVLSQGDGPILASADLLVEGRHFDLAYSSFEDVGAKAVAVNVSDIAAMGGRPRFLVVSVGLRPDQATEDIQHLTEGIVRTAGEFGVVIVGGDTVSSDPMIVSICILGEVPETGAVLRSGAQQGDLIGVTGALGGAAAGLALMRAGSDEDAAALMASYPELADAHRRGRARPREGAAAAAAGVHAMIDVSDGFAADLGHVATASGLRAVVDGALLPAARGVEEVEVWLRKRSPDSQPRLAATGGDDYELIMVFPPHAARSVAAAMEPTPLTVVGSFVEGEGVEVSSLPDGARGWDHFTDDA